MDQLRKTGTPVTRDSEDGSLAQTNQPMYPSEGTNYTFCVQKSKHLHFSEYRNSRREIDVMVSDCLEANHIFFPKQTVAETISRPPFPEL